VKVLVKLFQKLAQWRLRKPPRPSQRAKPLKRRFLFDNFFFCANGVKRKAAEEFVQIHKSVAFGLQPERTFHVKRPFLSAQRKTLILHNPSYTTA
jgi:hypothetical protein